MNSRRVLAYLWSSPTTLVGIGFLPLALVTGGRARLVSGVIEIHGGAARFFLRHCTLLKSGASAMTLGHVILGQDEQALNACRSHEHVHVRQCERWGVLFIPAYLIAGAVAWLRGQDPYRDNPFERQAFDR